MTHQLVSLFACSVMSNLSTRFIPLSAAAAVPEAAAPSLVQPHFDAAHVTRSIGLPKYRSFDKTATNSKARGTRRPSGDGNDVCGWRVVTLQVKLVAWSATSVLGRR